MEQLKNVVIGDWKDKYDWRNVTGKLLGSWYTFFKNCIKTMGENVYT